MAAGGDLPHDLHTFVIEAALGLDHGFWGCVADGATFKTLGRKRTPQGRAVISEHRADLEAAEAQVNAIYFAWRAGTGTELDDDLDTMLARWKDLPDGGDLELRWSPARPVQRHATHRHRSH
jgi:hypothetical protein